MSVVFNSLGCQEGQERLHHFHQQRILCGVKIYEFCSRRTQRKGTFNTRPRANVRAT